MSRNSFGPWAFEPGLPRAEILPPTHHLGLLVEMAIEEHRVVGISGTRSCGDFHIDDRRAALELNDFQREPIDLLCTAPGSDKSDRLCHLPILFPAGIKGGRLIRNRDVFDQLRNDALVPHSGDELSEDCVIEFRYGRGGSVLHEVMV